MDATQKKTESWAHKRNQAPAAVGLAAEAGSRDCSRVDTDVEALASAFGAQLITYSMLWAPDKPWLSSSVREEQDLVARGDRLGQAWA